MLIENSKKDLSHWKNKGVIVVGVLIEGYVDKYIEKYPEKFKRDIKKLAKYSCVTWIKLANQLKYDIKNGKGSFTSERGKISDDIDDLIVDVTHIVKEKLLRSTVYIAAYKVVCDTSLLNIKYISHIAASYKFYEELLKQIRFDVIKVVRNDMELNNKTASQIHENDT